ncbi:hypothetical protein ACE41H_15225 [Paenibacillus enshidis]|uniref:Uncharacterized protein n=1 Tax=Paenibacillus enshidis TaxID=1458439 RepID=A0ABV5AV93_9BACL
MDKKYAIARENDKEQTEFLQNLYGDDCYTDDLGCVLELDEVSARLHLIDDEYVIELRYDEDGCIEDFVRIEGEEEQS